jgi:hypothetical protein
MTLVLPHERSRRHSNALATTSTTAACNSKRTASGPPSKDRVTARPDPARNQRGRYCAYVERGLAALEHLPWPGEAG